MFSIIVPSFNNLNYLKICINSIKKHLPNIAKRLHIHTVAAAPRKPELKLNGKIRSKKYKPNLNNLVESLVTRLEEQGELLLSLNALQIADRFHEKLKKGRLKRNKIAAQGIIGKFATIKASGVAANPILMIDLAAGLACDTAMIIKLSEIYGLELGGKAARELLKQLSIYNSLLGGAQLSLQFLLGVIKHLLLVTAPLTGGLSIASAGPVAIAQAAIAVYTTKLTGKLAAKKFLKDINNTGSLPRLLLNRLARKESQMRLLHWNLNSNVIESSSKTLALLP